MLCILPIQQTRPMQSTSSVDRSSWLNSLDSRNVCMEYDSNSVTALEMPKQPFFTWSGSLHGGRKRTESNLLSATFLEDACIDEGHSYNHQIPLRLRRECMQAQSSANNPLQFACIIASGCLPVAPNYTGVLRISLVWKSKPNISADDLFAERKKTYLLIYAWCSCII